MTRKSDFQDNALDVDKLKDLWRALGTDYARYGLYVPDDCEAPFYEGYRAEQHRGGHAQPTKDVYIRKWCQLRTNALRRQRAVAESFTAQTIETIDVPVCPVTLEPLTTATGNDTDWSVDRINNNFAYAFGNVAIMSTRANHAKSAKSFDEVLALANATTERDGLKPQQWARLTALMYGPAMLETGRMMHVRQVAPVYPWLIHVTFQELQELFVRFGLLSYNHRRQVERQISNPTLRTEVAALNMLVANRVRELESPYDIWFNDDIFRRVCEYPDLCDEEDADLVSWIRQIYPHIEIDQKNEADLHRNTKGFLFDSPLSLPETVRHRRKIH